MPPPSSLFWNKFSKCWKLLYSWSLGKALSLHFEGSDFAGAAEQIRRWFSAEYFCPTRIIKLWIVISTVSLHPHKTCPKEAEMEALAWTTGKFNSIKTSSVLQYKRTRTLCFFSSDCTKARTTSLKWQWKLKL